MKNGNQNEKKKNAANVAAAVIGAAAGTLGTFIFMNKKSKADCQEAYECGFYKGYRGSAESNPEAAAFYEKLAKKYTVVEAEPEAEPTETEPAPEPEAEPTETEKK